MAVQIGLMRSMRPPVRLLLADPMHRVGEEMSKFSAYEYRTQPGFDQSKFEGANQAIPMKTLVIHCFDPRAAEIPQKVAEYFGDEVYPGENILDEAGNRVGNTRTLFAEANAGGRAAYALLSVAAMDYIFNVQNVVVVHRVCRVRAIPRASGVKGCRARARRRSLITVSSTSCEPARIQTDDNPVCPR